MQTTARRSKEEFSFDLKKIIAPLSERNDKGYRKELTLVSFNGGDAKYDIRQWDTDHLHMSKGISLTEEELRALAKAVETL